MPNSEHDDKHFVIQKGKAKCDKGTKFPNFKVTSQNKHYWNNADGQDDYLAVTEEDVMFNPPTIPFGNCSIKNGKPCVYAPSGKWTKTYNKVKVMGKSCLTEISELKCATGGKISIMNHGQKTEITKAIFKNVDAEFMQSISPFFNFNEFVIDIEKQDLGDFK